MSVRRGLLAVGYDRLWPDALFICAELAAGRAALCNTIRCPDSTSRRETPQYTVRKRVEVLVDQKETG